MAPFRPLSLFAAGLLAGCTALVPSGVARLSALSPIEADPARIAVALVLPEGLDLVPGSARLAVSARREDTGEMTAGDFALAAAPAEPGSFGADGGTVRILALDPTAVEPMRALQAEVRDWKAAGAETHGEIAVRLAACRFGAGPAPDARASVFVRTEAGGAFFPVLRNGAVSAVSGADMPTGPETCPGTAQGTEGPH